jgi:alpha-N-arabinofuranosidase
MKMFKEHSEQYLIPTLANDVDERLNVLSSISEDGNNITVSIINQDLYTKKHVDLDFKNYEWQVEKADVLNSENVRNYNTFDEPYKINLKPFNVNNLNDIIAPPHSVIRICLKKN